jgi:acetoin utilization deacetylase AcuC-like enzyme
MPVTLTAGVLAGLSDATAQSARPKPKSMPASQPTPPESSKLQTALLADKFFKAHQPGTRHPERPERLDAVIDEIESSGLDQGTVKIERRTATEDDIALCHHREYIATAKRDIQAGGRMLSTGDTSVSADSWDVALDAAGSLLNAVDLVVARKAKNAFCLVRPPGHHATPNRGMGFCVFNNIAVAARYAQKTHGLDRVLIADWDVHHGNGTQDIFYNDGSVYFFSTHQSPWYPGTGDARETGDGTGKGATLNCPFPAGSGREDILRVLRGKLLPIARDYTPALVMISAGFDSRRDDPLGQFTLSDNDFGELTEIMLEIADTFAGGRLVSVLEGGYNLDGLASAATGHFKVLRQA